MSAETSDNETECPTKGEEEEENQTKFDQLELGGNSVEKLLSTISEAFEKLLERQNAQYEYLTRKINYLRDQRERNPNSNIVRKQLEASEPRFHTEGRPFEDLGIPKPVLEDLNPDEFQLTGAVAVQPTAVDICSHSHMAIHGTVERHPYPIVVTNPLLSESRIFEGTLLNTPVPARSKSRAVPNYSTVRPLPPEQCAISLGVSQNYPTPRKALNEVEGWDPIVSERLARGEGVTLFALCALHLACHTT
jgi:hypothetical protein